jgi:hypothetical protein
MAQAIILARLVSACQLTIRGESLLLREVTLRIGKSFRPFHRFRRAQLPHLRGMRLLEVRCLLMEMRGARVCPRRALVRLGGAFVVPPRTQIVRSLIHSSRAYARTACTETAKDHSDEVGRTAYKLPMISETDISSRGRSLEQLERRPERNLGPSLFAPEVKEGTPACAESSSHRRPSRSRS